MLDIQIRQSCGLSEITQVRQVRFLVLRKPLGLPYEETLFAGDENPDTRHLVAYLNSQPIGCLTLMPPETISNEKQPTISVQLRGMAILEELQGMGVGSKMLGYVSELAREHHWDLWCKARQSAVAFYAASGWRVVGDVFDIPKIGPHFIMELTCEANV
jgi:predicted GNAT family N-acyltransferase